MGSPGPLRDRSAAEVDVLDGTGTLSRADVAFVRESVRAACAVLGLTGEARIRVAGDREMSRLHATHLGEASTTDVLTFDLAVGDGPGGGLGDAAHVDADIVVCLDEAARRAPDMGHGVERELVLYALHGVLHCAGFDDKTEEGAARMHEEEDRVLELIGIGAVYRPDARAGGTAASAGRGALP